MPITKTHIHPFAYMNLIGDSLHNFIDGLIIAASFITNIQLGIATTLAVALHEIPQEIGDFAVLIYGGFSRSKALFYNFLSASVAVIGAAVGFYFANHLVGFSGILLPIAAGGFIYIAACDLIPELHKQPDLKTATSAMGFFLAGIMLMVGFKFLSAH